MDGTSKDDGAASRVWAMLLLSKGGIWGGVCSFPAAETGLGVGTEPCALEDCRAVVEAVAGDGVGCSEEDWLRQ